MTTLTDIVKRIAGFLIGAVLAFCGIFAMLNAPHSEPIFAILAGIGLGLSGAALFMKDFTKI